VSIKTFRRGPDSPESKFSDPFGTQYPLIALLDAEQLTVTPELHEDLHLELEQRTIQFAEEIIEPTMPRIEVVDRLLDLRNLGHGRDLGLELTVDAMLESVPAGNAVSSEWWMSCLTELIDHAVFLAAGYPPATSELIAA